MELPNGAIPARLEAPATPANPTNSTTTKNPTLPSYANTISLAPSSSTNPLRRGKETMKNKQITHTGVSAVIFKHTEYYGLTATECKFTLVGQFLRARPQIDSLRSSLKELIKLKGTATIGFFDTYNVFFDFTTEEDFNTFCYRRVIDIEVQQMWLQKWSLDVKPEEDLPIAPVSLIMMRSKVSYLA
ncbi:uncharacterized protein LOC132623978 [Lycium barbarum]|uniref:uncharacterized protein LOC132623978 n=1 Tax=Lycium barbarum TaxID=112863 RepID=UPI00293E05A9|nr:uncharacterized protein LOC132623978 [Lycium barbarum]